MLLSGRSLIAICWRCFHNCDTPHRILTEVCWRRIFGLSGESTDYLM
jgi:hypothetical protein